MTVYNLEVEGFHTWQRSLTDVAVVGQVAKGPQQADERFPLTCSRTIMMRFRLRCDSKEGAEWR